MQNCIAIDWLQCHVKVPRRDYENLFDGKHFIVKKVDNTESAADIDYRKLNELQSLNERYKLERSGIQTRNFKAIFEIKDRRTGEDIAVLAAEPRSVMCMNDDSGLIKITNKYLYQKNFSHFVRALFSDLSLKFINITRIDLAYDFLTFHTMSCNSFLTMFQQEYFIKKQQSKVKMMGDTVSVDKGKKTGGFSSIKFGLESSDVNYYLYNKTLELSQVKDKPWIRDHWISNGWDKITDVWRLEFSLHPDQKGIAVVDENGELKTVHHFKNLEMLDNIDDIYRHCFDKHFQFVHAEMTKKGNWKKQSRCEPVVLFDFIPFSSCKIDLSVKKDSSRAVKIFAKKQMQFNQEMRGQDFELSISGNEVFTKILLQHDLIDWAKKKLTGFDIKNLCPRIVEEYECKKNFDANVRLTSSPEIKQRIEDVRVKRNRELYEFKVSKFAIVPDGKVLEYNSDGSVRGFIDAPF
jgi:hypothetical protein